MSPIIGLVELIEGDATVISRTEVIFVVIVERGVFDVSETVTVLSSRLTSFPRILSPFERAIITSCFGAFF